MKNKLIAIIILLVASTIIVTAVCILLDKNDDVQSNNDLPYDFSVKEEQMKQHNQPRDTLRNDLNVKKENLTFIKTPDNDFGDWYEGNNKTKYIFEKETGNYTGFIKAAEEYYDYNKVIESSDNYKQLANQAASKFIDVFQYTVSYFYQEDTHVHKYYYYRYISGYKTSDTGNVYIYPDGTVGLARFFNTNKFSMISIPFINEDAIDKKFIKELYKKNKNIHSYKIRERVLTIENDELYMKYEYIFYLDDDFSQVDTLLIKI